MGFPVPNMDFSFQLISIFLRMFFDASESFVVKAFLLLPLPVAALTMYWFLSRLLPSRYWRVGLSLAYAMNGFALTSFLTGSAAVLIAGALFPLFLLCSAKFIENEHYLFNLLASSVLLTLAVSFLIQAYAWFVFFAVFAALSSSLAHRTWRHLLRGAILVLIASGLAFLLLLPTLLVPFVDLLQGQTITAFVGHSPSSISDLVKSFYLTFANSVDIYFLLYIIAILCLGGLLIRKVEISLRFWSFVLSVTVLVALLLNLRLTSWTPNEPTAILIFYSFDYPQLAMFVAVWALILLAAINVHEASVGTNKARRYIMTALSVIAIVSLLLYQVQDSSGVSSTQFYSGHEWQDSQISQSIIDIHSWLVSHNSNQTSYRTIWLPSPPSSYFVTLLAAYDPSSILALPSNSVIQPLESMVMNNGSDVGKIFASANVEYFVVDLAAVQFGGQWATGQPRIVGDYPVGSPVQFVNLLSEQNDLKVVESNQEFVIFKNLDYVPMIAVYPSLNASKFFAPSVRQLGPTTFETQLNGSEPLAIVFGQSYNADWTAYVDGNVLPHSSYGSFGTNVFLYGGGENSTVSLVLSYRPQGLQNQAIIISAFLWLSIGAVIVLSYVKMKRPQSLSEGEPPNVGKVTTVAA